MKKIIILLLVLLVGCDMIKIGVQRDLSQVEVRAGVEAVRIDLHNPNPKVFAGQNFFLIATLENRGASDVKEGFYNVISGEFLNITKINNNGKKGNFSLVGKSIHNPRGEVRQILIEGTVNILEEQMERFVEQLTFHACYDYETVAMPTVCIDANPMYDGPKACRPSTVFLSGGQGGPVQITKVEPKMVPTANGVLPHFEIYLRRPLSGIVLEKGKAESACGIGDVDAFNKINVSVKVQNNLLTCGFESVKLREDESKIVCRLLKNEDYDSNVFPNKLGAFTTVLEINVSYAFANSAATSFEITKL